MVIGKGMKRNVLKEVTTLAGIFDGLAVNNSHNDTIDKNAVDGFWAAMGSTKDKGSTTH